VDFGLLDRKKWETSIQYRKYYGILTTAKVHQFCLLIADFWAYFTEVAEISTAKYDGIFRTEEIHHIFLLFLKKVGLFYRNIKQNIPKRCGKV